MTTRIIIVLIIGCLRAAAGLCQSGDRTPDLDVLADTAVAGELTVKFEGKYLSHLDRYKQYKTYRFGILPGTGKLIGSVSRFTADSVPTGRVIYMNDSVYYIVDDGREVRIFPARKLASREELRDNQFMRQAIPSMRPRPLPTLENLRDTTIDGDRYRYSIESEHNDSVRMGHDGPSVAMENSRKFIAYFTDINTLKRSDEYYTMQGDTQIALTTLLATHRYTSPDELQSMLRDTLAKYLASYAVLVFDTTQSTKPPVSSLDSGAQCPAFCFITLDSEARSLSDFTDSVILLDLSYNGCFPCRMAVPDLRRLHRRFHDRGFSVVNVNPFDEPREIEHGMRRDSVNYPVYRIVRQTVEDLGVKAYPQFILIDSKRRIVASITGYSPLLYDRLADAIEKCLAKR